MSTPITSIVSDFKAALEEGLEVAAGEITEQLKIEGPYWTGFFESLWVVEPGKTKIVANIKDASTSKKKRPGRDYTDVFVPESPNFGGYTIGNKANYRLYAMDILPSLRGGEHIQQQTSLPRKTGLIYTSTPRCQKPSTDHFGAHLGGSPDVIPSCTCRIRGASNRCTSSVGYARALLRR